MKWDAREELILLKSTEDMETMTSCQSCRKIGGAWCLASSRCVPDGSGGMYLDEYGGMKVGCDGPKDQIGTTYGSMQVTECFVETLCKVCVSINLSFLSYEGYLSI